MKLSHFGHGLKVCRKQAVIFSKRIGITVNKLFRYISNWWSFIEKSCRLSTFNRKLEFALMHLWVHYPHETIPVGSPNLDTCGSNSHHLLSIFYMPSIWLNTSATLRLILPILEAFLWIQICRVRRGMCVCICAYV